MAGAGGFRVLAASGKPDDPDRRFPGHREKIRRLVVHEADARQVFFADVGGKLFDAGQFAAAAAGKDVFSEK